MNPAKWKGYWEEHAGRLMWLVAAVWTILVGASLLSDLHRAREFALELARTEANLSFEKDLAYRLWAARHGGVYVPATPQSPPNPYLAEVPERDIRTPSGRVLTLLNPAYMTRQVHELTAQLYGSRGHLTSLKPLRPENAPDAWETGALQAFEAGKSEVIERVSMAGQPYLRFMRPFRTEQVCLRCHASQGYQAGDIRGGISVAVPLQPYLAGIRTQTIAEAVSHSLIWLLGTAGIFVGGRRIRKHFNELRQAEAKLAETLREKEEALAQMERLASFPKLNPNPVLEIDPQGVITYSNQAAGDAIEQLAPDVSLRNFLPQNWQELQKSIRETGEKKYECEIRLKDRVFSESISFTEPFEVWRIYARDITERKQAEAALQRAHEELEERVRERTQELGHQSALLEGINRLLRAALSSGTEEQLNRTALTVAEEVTGAGFGFIEELDLEGRLKPLAISDPGWEGCGMSDTDGLALCKHLEIKGLYRSVIQEGLPLIANNPAAHPDSLDVPAGHPPLNSFLGVPLRRGDQVIGLIGLGNKAGGFDEADRQALETLAAAVIEALGRFRAEAKAASTGRLYRVLSRVNETIVRAKDPEELFRQTCQIAVEEGDFRMTWIGLLDQEKSMVKPVAKFGYEQGYLDNLMIPFSDVPESRGPTGIAIREGRYDVCNNYATDPRMTPWRDKALERGYNSSAAFPLRVGSQVVGAITLYADRAGFFTEDEVGLLDSLSQDISFALESMDREARRQAAVEEIRQLNAELEERVQMRTSELSQVVTDLEQKNAEIERFTYMISHDLKSPLVTISTFLGYLEKDMASGDADRIAKDMRHMYTAADKMGRLLNELLEMSRIGRMINPPVTVTFRELVEEALNAVAGPLSGRGLDVEVSQGEVTLYGDRPRLVEIWQNLVENAVKFMGEQPAPRLTIGAERQGPDTVFFVCDNGIGIEPQYQNKIFGIFEKLDSMAEGTGIGLALVKRIVELYQGNIWVESAGLGQGSCFRFTLPGAIKGAKRDL